MLEEQLSKDYIQAMKARDSFKSTTLNFLRAQLKNALIDQRKDKLEDGEVIAILKKQVKQRQDSIEQYEKGGRAELAEKEKKELALIKTYLPEELPEDELKKIVDEAVQSTGASGMKDMGAVMKVVMEKVAGRADNKVVSNLVRQALGA